VSFRNTFRKFFMGAGFLLIFLRFCIFLSVYRETHGKMLSVRTKKTQRKIISQRSIGVSGLSAYDFSPCIVILTPGRKK